MDQDFTSTHQSEEPTWPPVLLNRETQRHCEHRYKGNDDDGYYCTICGKFRPKLGVQLR